MLRRFSPLFIALSLAACGSSTASTQSESASTSGSEQSSSSEAAPRFAIVSVDQVATRVEAHDAHLAVYDANHRETFDEHHVPGATWVHYDSVTADVLPADHATSLVFYCANEQCSASHVAAEAAVDLGYTDVSVMGGGIQGWIDAGKPVEAGTPAAPPPS
jgi:rhodanese-related sulfurtransferase